MAELMKLHQRKTISEHYEKFNAIVTYLNLLEDYMISCFLDGLRKDNHMLVRMFQLTTINKSFSLPRLECRNTRREF